MFLQLARQGDPRSWPEGEACQLLLFSLSPLLPNLRIGCWLGLLVYLTLYPYCLAHNKYWTHFTVMVSCRNATYVYTAEYPPYYQVCFPVLRSLCFISLGGTASTIGWLKVMAVIGTNTLV